MKRAQIVKTVFEPGESKTVYGEANAKSWEDKDFRIVRKPRFDTDSYVLHKKSRVMVTWIYQGREITDDKKRSIIDAYAKRGHIIRNFTKAAYLRFKKDLEEEKIIPYFSRRYSDIFFLLK